jgi:sterol desaturase/sphingolipid hydroxylase (fatty acid hydroxylase superfamily)
MWSFILTVLITFFAGSLFGYVTHWALHQKWTRFLNKKHMTHHLKLYPPSNYLSDVYRQSGNDNTVIIFAIAAIPVVAFPIVLWLVGWLSVPLMITSVAVMAIMAFLHNYLHDSFHIRKHWLTRVPVIKTAFKYWNRLHYLHHVDMQKNFGIFLFHWDHVFGTFWKDKK